MLAELLKGRRGEAGLRIISLAWEWVTLSRGEKEKCAAQGNTRTQGWAKERSMKKHVQGVGRETKTAASLEPRGFSFKVRDVRRSQK